MFTYAAAILAFGGLLGNASPLKRQTVDGVQNALGLSKDPSAFSQLVSGTRQYYFPNIEGDSHLITLQTSDNLNTVLADPSNNYTIFKTTDRPNDTGFFKYDTNNYLITYALNPPAPALSYLRTLQNTGTDLTKGWNDIGQIKDSSGNVLEHVYDSQGFLHPNGNRYLLYSHAGNSIFIAQMTSPTTVTNPTMVYTVNNTVEAPGVLVQGNTINIFWSENLYTTPKYNVIGFSTSTSDNPTSASTWKGLPTTTLLASSSTNGVYGPGSASTFTGPDSKPWIAYDCFYTASGLNGGARRGQVQPIQFNGNVIAPMTPLKPSRFVTSTTS